MWALFFLVFLAGLVDSIAGGGGLITLPAYYAFGIPPHLALGTNKFVSSLGTLTATACFVYKGQVHWGAALWASGAALLGSPLGARLALALEERYLQYILLVAVPLLAVLMLVKRDFGQGNPTPLSRGRTALLATLTGLVVGAYDGFFGPGTGTFFTLIFTALLGLDIVQACGSTKVVNLASNLAALATYAAEGKVLLSVGLPCAIFSVAGNLLGSALAIRGGARVVRPIMLVTMTLLLLKVGAELL